MTAEPHRPRGGATRPRWVAASEWAYGWLLRTYPSPFRNAWSGQMREAFESEMRDASARRGALGGAMVWSHVLIDYVRSVIAEHTRLGTSRRGGRRQRHSNDSNRERGDMVYGLWRDLRFAVRGMAKAPGFTAIAVVILALGIGANTTIFTVVNALFLTPPPHVVAPEELVRINRLSRSTSTGALSYPDYAHVRDRNESLVDVFAYDSDHRALNVGFDGDLFPITGGFVSGNYFTTLGVTPAIGRTLLPDDDAVGDPALVAVLSHRLWTGSFGADRSVLGKSVSLNGRAFTVVGVAPAGFRGISPVESPPDLWLPVTTAAELAAIPPRFLYERVEGEINRWVWAVGRLRPGVSFEQASANVSGLGEQLAQAYPAWNEGQGLAMSAGVLHGGHRASLVKITRLLTAVAAIVLIIASANLAILLLAKASDRQGEIGVRVALGATRSRLVRQLLVEGVVLSVAGGVAGFFVAFFTADVAAALMPLSFSVDITPRVGVLAFAMGISVVTALLFGIVPAMQATRANITDSVKGQTGGRARSFLQDALVVTQVMLAVILVVGASLFARSLLNARTLDLGFDHTNRLVAAAELRSLGYDTERALTFTRRGIERLRGLPGVRAVSTTRLRPFRGQWGSTIVPEGVTMEDPDDRIDSGFNAVGPRYFATMNIPIVQGREFTDADDDSSIPVAVINETLANRLWTAETAVGKTFRRGEVTWTVVGVAKTATYYALGEAPEAQVYLPTFQLDSPSARYFLIETAGPAPGLGRSVQAALNAIEPQLALSEVLTLEEAFRGEISQYRVTAAFVSLFGGLALVLATVGLYGVLSYLVARRQRDIGIRVALGATQRRVAREVVRRGLILVGGGIVAGLGVAVAAAGVVESFLFGVQARDPVTLLGVPLVLLAAAVAATLAPALRATRVDPLVVLRAG